MNKLFWIPVAFLFVLASCKQGFKVNPSSPEPGKEISVSLPAADTKLNQYDTIYGYAYAVTNDKPQVVDFTLLKNKETYEGSFIAPDSAVAVYIYFFNGKEIDNNNEKGYTVLLTSNGKPFDNASLLLLNAMRNNSYYWNESGFIPGMDKMVTDEYAKNSDRYSVKDLLTYYGLYQKTKSNVDSAYEKQILDKILTKELTSKEAATLKEHYAKLKDTSNFAKLDELIGDAVGTSNNNEQELREKIMAAKGSAAKLAVLTSYKDTTTKGPDESDYLLDFMTYYTCVDLMNEKNYSKVLEVSKYAKDPQIPSIMQSNVLLGLLDGDAPLTAESSKIVEMVINEPAVEPKERDVYSNSYQIARSAKQSKDLKKAHHARYLLKQGKTDEALALFREIEKDDVLSYYSYGSYYAKALASTDQPDAVVDLWKAMKLKEISNKNTDSIAQAVVQSGAAAVKDWDAFKEEVNKEVAAASAKKIKEKFVSLPAPNFELKDHEGKTVTLNDLKGKKLMIDFWATWCGPCLMSFPDMKKIQAHLAETDSTVKFLFVQTWENGEYDKIKENSIAFLEKNDYPFYVLLDHPALYVNQFQVGGIPCKVFIDQNGNFRYKSIGYYEGYDKNLSDLETIFKLMD